MNISSAFPALPVAIPLLGAALIAAMRKWLSRAVADFLAIAFTGCTLICSCALLLESLHRIQVYWFGNWYPRGSVVLGITFVVDPVPRVLRRLPRFSRCLHSYFPGALWMREASTITR